MKFIRFFFFLLIVKYIKAKDLLTIGFIKSYIENEKKPTDLICDNLGWDKSDYINLIKELSSVRTAALHKSFAPSAARSAADVRILFLIDLETSNMDVLKNMASYFRAPYRWLVLGDTTNEGRSKLLWDLPLLIDSDFVLAVRNGDTFDMIELHKTSPGGPTHVQPRGAYNGTFVDVRPGKEMYRRRRDVLGYEMVMSSVIQESNASKQYLIRGDRLNLHQDCVSKMAAAVSKVAFEMVNATPKYIFNKRFGYKDNGTWSGMIMDVSTGKAIIGTNMLLNVERLNLVDYTDTTSPFQMRFVFRQLPLAEVSNIFTLPFSIDVWVAIVVCATISIFALFFNTRWGTSEEDKSAGGITDAILITMSALSTQGSSIIPSSYSGRMIFFMVFLSMMLIYTAYTANIVALLQAPSDSIKTVDQLVKSKLTLGGENLDYQRFLFLNDKRIKEKMFPEHGKKQLFSTEECARKIRSEPYAIHCSLNPMYRRMEQTYLEKDKCDLATIDYLNSFSPAAPMTKGTPYIELMKVSFKRIREVGIYSMMVQHFNIRKPKCSGQAAAFTSIGLQNVKPVLFLYLIGVAASLLISVMEIFVYRVSLSRQKKLVVEI